MGKTLKRTVPEGFAVAVMCVVILVVFAPGRASALDIRPGWNLVAMPCTMTSAELSSKVGAADFSAYGWADNRYFKADTLERGKAYFLKSVSASTVAGLCLGWSGNIGSFIPRLKAGWNLVGNPYNSEYSMKEILAGMGADGIVRMLAYSKGALIEKKADEKLGRWEGVFVYYQGTAADGSNCMPMCETDAECQSGTCLEPGMCSSSCIYIAEVVNTEPSGDVKTVSNGISRFTTDIYKKVKDNDNGNVVFSPYSLATLLSMIYLGAANNTEKQIADVLHVYFDKDKYHQTMKELNTILMPKADGFELTVANGSWVKKDYDINAMFLLDTGKYYGAVAQQLDFGNDPGGSSDAINNWVSGMTNGMIGSIVDKKSITPDLRLLLANAVYFKAGWTYVFDRAKTVAGKFNMLDGTTKDVDMMTFGKYGEVQLPELVYYSNYSDYSADTNTSDINFKALELPYKNSNIVMMILLPEIGKFKEFESLVDANYLDTILEKLQGEREVEVTMPKFKFEYSFDDLKKVLSSLGMGDAFDSNAADFTKINANDDLFIGFIKQKAIIDVNEEGTSAAAVSAGGAIDLSLPPKFVADRPFIYLIRDKFSGAILFMGRVTDPKY